METATAPSCPRKAPDMGMCQDGFEDLLVENVAPMPEMPLTKAFASVHAPMPEMPLTNASRQITKKQKLHANWMEIICTTPSNSHERITACVMTLEKYPKVQSNCEAMNALDVDVIQHLLCKDKCSLGIVMQPSLAKNSFHGLLTSVQAFKSC